MDDVPFAERRYRIVPRPPGEVAPIETYELLEEWPDKIECWIKQIGRDEPGVTQVLSLTSINGEYMEKSVAFKWEPDLKLLAIEKVEGRGRVSFEHIKRPCFEICLTYFGNVLIGKLINVTDVAAAKIHSPILMKQTTQSELADWIPLDSTYKTDECLVGYDDKQSTNLHLQLIIEEDFERVLDNNGYVFSEDGKSYNVWCNHCEHVPCVWERNKESMKMFDTAEHDEDTEPNKRRHALYRQMALIINDGPTGKGNRLKLPTCVVSGVRGLFPDPESNYTGHREME
jgi:hypothetical protein